MFIVAFVVNVMSGLAGRLLNYAKGDCKSNNDLYPVVLLLKYRVIFGTTPILSYKHVHKVNYLHIATTLVDQILIQLIEDSHSQLRIVGFQKHTIPMKLKITKFKCIAVLKTRTHMKFVYPNFDLRKFLNYCIIN